MDVTIRFAIPEDAPVIAGFNAAMAIETERLDLDGARLLAGVRAVLDDAGRGFYLLAVAGGEVVGQMLVTFEWSDWRNGAFWWIQSVYVKPAFRRQGVFRTLYRHLADRAEADPGVCGLRLYVERENRSAQRAYERLGMRSTRYRMYEVDFVMDRSAGHQ